MTPAIRQLQRCGVAHRVLAYDHDPAAGSYGLEAVQRLGLDPAEVFKTLLVEADGVGLAVAVVPVAARLDVKAAARAVGAKRATMADAAAAERATGYVVGGISPFGQRKRLPTVVDASAEERPAIYVSAGRRGLEVEVAPSALVRLLGARFAPLQAG